MPSSDPTLFSLLQAYSALKHPRFLSFPSHLPFLQVHDFVLSCILLNPHLLQYPPSHTYQLSFWKWAIEHLENLLGDEAGVPLPFTSDLPIKSAQEDAEIDQLVYDRLVSLVAIGKPAYVPRVCELPIIFRTIFIGLTMPLHHHPRLSSLITGNRLLNLVRPCQPTLSPRRNTILSLYSSPALLSRVVPLDCGHGVPVSC
jgi:hypothetical protein